MMAQQTHLPRLFEYIFILTIVFMFTGCMPLNDRNINTELFENKEVLKTKTAELTAGMGKKIVFKALNVQMEKFNRLSTLDIQAALYGNSLLQGTPAELEKFRKRLMRFEGYSLPYQSIKSKGSFGFGKMKIKKTGYNLILVLIFENSKLLKASVEGQQNVNEKEDQFFWNSILKTGVSAAI